LPFHALLRRQGSEIAAGGCRMALGAAAAILLLFFRPEIDSTIPAREARFTYTFGLGGISLLLFIVLVVTGVIEMFVYVPTPEGAPVAIPILTPLNLANQSLISSGVGRRSLRLAHLMKGFFPIGLIGKTNQPSLSYFNAYSINESDIICGDPSQIFYLHIQQSASQFQ